MYCVRINDKRISKISDLSLHGEGQEDVTRRQISMNDLWLVVVKTNETFSRIPSERGV